MTITRTETHDFRAPRYPGNRNVKQRCSATLVLRGIGSMYSPGVSITGEESRYSPRNRDADCDGYVTESCGQLPDMIRQHFPAVHALRRWHLCDLAGVPMHYEANAAHWLKLTAPEDMIRHFYPWYSGPRSYDPDPLEVLPRHLVLGACPDDAETYAEYIRLSREIWYLGSEAIEAFFASFTAWLDIRRSGLAAALYADLDNYEPGLGATCRDMHEAVMAERGAA